ncbi:hypothetical protein F4825DRAFT_471216 [Nemania diffusa]|nr:hypothetical protein F4825DRAFT_471216 [Nemania diffusa]
MPSVSAVMDLALRPDQVVPEEILEDLSVPAAAGHGESKYIAERMLAYAAEKLQIPVAIARIGQVCGASRSLGRWNPHEWIPPRAQVYHLMNPECTSWAALPPTVLKILSDSKKGTETSVALVSCQEWLKRLRGSVDNLDVVHSKSDFADINPASRLIYLDEEKFTDKIFPQWESENATSKIALIQQVICGEKMASRLGLCYRLQVQLASKRDSW